MSTNGVASGATFGLFTFGMFYPRGNAKVRIRYFVMCTCECTWLERFGDILYNIVQNVNNTFNNNTFIAAKQPYMDVCARVTIV